MTCWLVPSVTFLGQILKLTYLGHYVPCYWLWPLVTSKLTWPKKVSDKSCRSSNKLSNTICCFQAFGCYLWFSRWLGRGLIWTVISTPHVDVHDSNTYLQGPRPILSASEPARNRVKWPRWLTVSEIFTACADIWTGAPKMAICEKPEGVSSVHTPPPRMAWGDSSPFSIMF